MHCEEAWWGESGGRDTWRTRCVGALWSFSHTELSKDKYCRRILYLPALPKKGFRSCLSLEGCQGGHSCGTPDFSLNCTCQLLLGELA